MIVLRKNGISLLTEKIGYKLYWREPIDHVSYNTLQHKMHNKLLNETSLNSTLLHTSFVRVSSVSSATVFFFCLVYTLNGFSIPPPFKTQVVLKGKIRELLLILLLRTYSHDVEDPATVTKASNMPASL